MRSVTIDKLLGSLPEYQDAWVLIHPSQSVKDIIREVLDAHQEFAPYYDCIALEFDADTTEEICKNLYKFLKKNIQYSEEKEEDQTSAIPTGILIRGFGDCKHYSGFSAGVLDGINRLTGKNINWNYRFASYDIFNKVPHHVFVVVKDSEGSEIWIDPTPGADNQTPVWQIDKKIKASTMALRRNIAGIGLAEIQTENFDVQPMQIDLMDRTVSYDPLILATDSPSPVITEALDEQNLDSEISPELQSAIQVLLDYGIMNDNGEVSDVVMRSLSTTLPYDEFDNIRHAREVLQINIEAAATSNTMGSFFSNLWRGVKKVSLSIPRNAYLGLVALNVFGYATKLYNSIYKEDGTFLQPNQDKLYRTWNKLGGDWHNLNNAILSGHKKNAILGALDPGISTGGESGSVGVAAAAIPAWLATASAIIAVITPLIKEMLRTRQDTYTFPSTINPATGLPYGVPDPSSSNGIMDWIQQNPIAAAAAAAGALYLINGTGTKKKVGRLQPKQKTGLLLLGGAAVIYFMANRNTETTVIDTGGDTGSGGGGVDTNILPGSTTDAVTPVTPTRTGFLFTRDLLPYYSTDFDMNAYLSRYPDIRQDKYYSQNPLQHWQEHGQFEGRFPSADPANVRYDSAFDAVYYLDRYPDLQQHFGSDYQKAYQHWLQYGRNEGRKPGGAYLITS